MLGAPDWLGRVPLDEVCHAWVPPTGVRACCGFAVWLLMVSPIFMRIRFRSFCCGAWGGGAAVAPPPVALFRMAGRLGTRAVIVVPRGRRACRLLARCAWLALAAGIAVPVACRLLVFW